MSSHGFGRSNTCAKVFFGGGHDLRDPLLMKNPSVLEESRREVNRVSTSRLCEDRFSSGKSLRRKSCLSRSGEFSRPLIGARITHDVAADCVAHRLGEPDAAEVEISYILDPRLRRHDTWTRFSGDAIELYFMHSLRVLRRAKLIAAGTYDSPRGMCFTTYACSRADSRTETGKQR